MNFFAKYNTVQNVNDVSCPERKKYCFSFYGETASVQWNFSVFEKSKAENTLCNFGGNMQC